MLRVLSRMFSKHYPPQSGQRYSKPFQSREAIFSELKNPQNYLNQSKFPEMLEKLFSFARSTWNDQTPTNWSQNNDLKETLKNWTTVISSLNAPQTAKLARILSGFNISTDEIWVKLEKHVQRKLLRELSKSDIVDLARAARSCERKADSFWNTLESCILNRVYPKDSFGEVEIAELYFAFYLTNKGSLELYSHFMENISRLLDKFSLKEIMKFVTSFSKQGNVDPKLTKGICTQAVKFLPECDGVKLQQLLSFFLRFGAEPGELEALENEVLKKLASLNLLNLSVIAFNLAKHGASSTKNKKNIMKEIEEHLSKNKISLVQNFSGYDIDTSICRLMWALASEGSINHLKMWKDYGKEMNNNQKLNTVELAPLIREIKARLISYGLY